MHEEQLALLQLQTSLVYKLPLDSPLSQALMAAVTTWQKDHKPGRAHPHGACSHFTAAALLVQLSHSKQRPPGVDVDTFRAFGNMVQDLGDEPHVQLVHKVAYCSARQNALKTHLILDFRPVLQSPLTKYAHVSASLLDSYDGERLGKKAPGGLSRKARGKNN